MRYGVKVLLKAVKGALNGTSTVTNKKTLQRWFETVESS